ncbi:glutamate ABC transporter substrate-binding protein [Streptomyces sp. NPDC050560]|uniref:glutamate ABC transporter substrate-binding protein n=1 Tax=Streptomyces sp. NPDC050560 TaxID=3365630 RepID=UPI0037B4CA89
MDERADVRRARRPVRLRGWGGVATMAGACALTAVCALLPLTRHGGGADADDGVPGTSSQQPARQAAAPDCKDPEASLSPSSTATDDQVKKIVGRGTLRVGIDQSSYGWGYLNPNKPLDPEHPEELGGTLEGFDIDLVHQIAKGILGDANAVRFLAIPTDQRIDAIKNNDVDMVVRTMTINCDRLKDVSFSTAYFETGQQVLAPKTSRITGYNASLKGKRVCVAAGSTAQVALEKESYGAKVLNSNVPNQLDCLVRMQLGRTDAIITDGALAAGQASQDPTVELKGKPFTEEYYGVAMRKGADALVRRVNQVLTDWRGSGWRHSYNDWLKEDMGPSSGPPAAKYK